MDNLADEEFQIATGILEDCRRLIAANKVQRWDVVKWGVSVNLALAVAAATPALVEIQIYLLFLSCGVAAASWLLVLHYNGRATGARKNAVTIIEWLKEKKIDYDSIIGLSTSAEYSSGVNYDRQELRLFASILSASPVLILLSLFFLHVK